MLGQDINQRRRQESNLHILAETSSPNLRATTAQHRHIIPEKKGVLKV